MPQIQLGAIDYGILVVYFAFVLGIGWAVRHLVRSSDDFFLSGRAMPTWIAGLAFLSANLGAQEVIGMAASGAKYGMMTSHFYWVGAIPAMVFVGVFMMPFYYGSKARSVPEYLKLRFDEKTRGFNAITFAAMTIFSSGISMYALAKLLELVIGWDLNFREFERYKDITPKEVLAVAKKTLDARRVSLSIVPEGKPELAAEQKTVERKGGVEKQ